MISGEREIQGYIGGSDSVRVHGSWNTATFQRFWRERISGEKETSFENEHTLAGNIMEGRILTAVGVHEGLWNRKFDPDRTIAGINTDAYDDSDGGTYHEAKNLLWTECWKWILGSAVSATYMYQLKHGLFVTGAQTGLLHVCMVTRAEKKNPFLITDVASRTHTFRFDREFFDYKDEVEKARNGAKTRPVTMWHYGLMIDYLTECYRAGKWPQEAKRIEIINSFS